MQARRIFLFIWRINAILILLVGVGGFVMVGIAIASTLGAFRGEHADDEIAEAALPTGKEQATRLGEFWVLRGSKMLRANLVVGDEPGGGSYSSYKQSITRNVLILDPDTGRAHWLLPQMTGVISRGYVIWKDGDPNQTEYDDSAEVARDAQALVVVYLTGDADLDGDQEVDDEDARNIALSDPDGSRFQVVLKGVTRLNRTGRQPDGKVMVLYTAGPKLRKAVFDPVTFEAVEDQEIVISAN